MTLEEYLQNTSTSVADFALRIAAKSRVTVYRYMKDHKMHRVPNPKMMLRIMKETGGLVSPTDFYPKLKTSALNYSDTTVNTV